jgi:hypothetical protein
MNAESLAASGGLGAFQGRQAADSPDALAGRLGHHYWVGLSHNSGG